MGLVLPEVDFSWKIPSQEKIPIPGIFNFPQKVWDNNFEKSPGFSKIANKFQKCKKYKKSRKSNCQKTREKTKKKTSLLTV